MGKCKNHRDEETAYFCQKHEYYVCDKCLKCNDPEIFCKFRSSCLIYFLEKKGGHLLDKERN